MQAEPAKADDLRFEVRSLVRQLDDNELAKRNEAEAALIKLGPDVMEFLPPVRSNTSAEVKVRMQRIRSALEKAIAQSAAEPALVTLSGEMKFSAALDAIEKQTGNRFVDFRRRFGQQTADPMVKADFEKTTFWQAVDQLFDQANVTTYSFGGEPGTLAIVGRDASELNRSDRAAYGGLFRFEGVRIQATRDLKNPENDALRYTFEAAWEPRLRPIVLQLSMNSIEALTGDGTSLDVRDPRSQIEVPVQPGIPAAELVVPLALPPRIVRKIDSLTGTLTALVPGRVEAFEFDDLENARAVKLQKAGATVILDQVRKNADLYEVRMRLQFDQAANALESHRGWVLNNEAYMLNAKNEKLENLGLEQTLQLENEVGMAYLFDCPQGLKGHTFVYKSPAMIIKSAVEYELKDIELP